MVTNSRKTTLLASTVLCALILLASACGSSAKKSSVTTTTATPKKQTVVTATLATWKLPYKVSRTTVVPDGSQFLALGGLISGDVSTSSVIEVNPSVRSSQTVGNLAQKLHDASGTSMNNYAFVFGGGEATTQDVVQRWSSNKTTVVGHLPTPRSDLSAVTVNGTSYIVGGFDGTNLSSDVVATQDGQSFTTAGQLAKPVRYGAALSSGSIIWIFGGETQTTEGGSVHRTDVIQQFDTSTGTGSIIGHLPTPLSHASAFMLDGNIYIAGGRTDAGATNSILRFDPSANAATQVATLPQAQSDAGVAVINGAAWLVGGEISGATDPIDTLTSVTAH